MFTAIPGFLIVWGAVWLFVSFRISDEIKDKKKCARWQLVAPFWPILIPYGIILGLWKFMVAAWITFCEAFPSKQKVHLERFLEDELLEAQHEVEKALAKHSNI
jgi:hypothetical protein